MGGACSGAEAQKVENIEAARKEEPQPAPEPEVPKPPPPPEPKLIITVIAARGLRNSDWLPGLGKPDCYCVITTAGRELFTTKIINDTLEPVWNEVAEIPAIHHTVGEPLEFSVYDKDVVGADFLGKVVVERGKYEHGFNGELQLDEAGQGIKAYLRLKIQVPGKDIPAGPPPFFHFGVDKGQHESYGLEVDPQDGKYLRVTHVGPGPFTEYNQKAAPELQLVQGDYITAVNGFTGSCTTMLDAFKKEANVAIVVRREMLETFILNRKDAKTPFGAEFIKKPILEALVITKIGDGLLKEFNDNTTDEYKKFQVGDRIVAVAGFKGKAAELSKRLGEAKGEFQLTISRPAPEEKSGHWRFWH